MKITTKIAGVHFRGKEISQIVRDLEKSTSLTLEKEFGNEHDPNAVRIMLNSVHLGYVPKDFSQEVAEELSRGVVEVTSLGGSKIEIKTPNEKDCSILDSRYSSVAIEDSVDAKDLGDYFLDLLM